MALLALALVACDPRDGPEGDATADARRDADTDALDGGEDAEQDPCPAEMALVDDGQGVAFCIDRYEHPGAAGAGPTTAVSWRTAQQGCVEARKVICLEEQWVRACAGTSADECRGPVAPAGSRPGCESSFGVWDMAGNVAEWTGTPGGAASWFARGGPGPRSEVGCDVREEIMAEDRREDLGYRCCRAVRR
jgi:hypothetical protein